LLVALGVLAAVITTAVVAFAVDPDVPNPPAPGVMPSEPPQGDFPNTTYVVLLDEESFVGSPESDYHRAEDAALTDTTVAARLAGARFRVVAFAEHGPFSDPAKASSDPCASRRCLDVIFYIYTDSVALDVFVETAGWTVVRTEESTKQPGPSTEEQDLAHKLAEDDPVVHDLIKRDKHYHRGDLAHPYQSTTGPCAVNRCVVVIFWIESSSLATGTHRELVANVDLSTERVADFQQLTCSGSCTPGW
jgi:hypothetical protein